MNLRLSAIAAALACAGALCSVAPASAAFLKIDLPTEARTAVQSDVTLVGSRRGFYRYNGHAYYNGHRGFRHHRRGYHRHSGYWFPRAAFVFSFTVRPRSYDRYYGVAPHRTPPRAKVIGLNHSHYRWCDAKYRSYRSYDNTFQPYHGPRKQCVSPYY